MSNVDIFVSNATPQSIHLGTNDKSSKPQSIVPLPRPMHLPFVHFFSQKGTTDEVVVDGASFNLIFGSETLNEHSPYFNHASPFIKGFLEDGGTVLAKRIVPTDAETLASIRISLEYVETNLNEYERDLEGNFKRGKNGEYIETGRQIMGYLYRWVTEEVPTTVRSVGDNDYRVFEFGQGSETIGDLVDGLGGTSKRIPVMDLAVSSPGAHGNLSGISIWSPRSNDQIPINNIALSDTDAYPFRLSLFTKETPTSNPVVSNSILGEREVDFNLKPGSKSKSGVQYYIGETFIDKYNDLLPTNPLQPPKYGVFSKIHVYQNNIDKLLEMFISKEINTELRGDFINVNQDNIKDKKYLFDIFGGRHTEGTQYQSYRQGQLGDKGVVMDQNVIFWAKGGSDGTMNDEVYRKHIEAWLEEMADPDGKYMDDVTYNDSCFYDTGLPLETKLKCGKYLANRKDRWLCMTTHVSGEENIIPVAEENSRLAAIRSAIRLYSDSTIFGTSAYRAVIVKGTGLLDKSVSGYSKRIPISYELARILSKYWGASSGRARSNYDYTIGTNNFFKYISSASVSNSWTPYRVRNTAWASGGMWSERSESKTDFFPAFRTIFDDDSSTLMTIRTMLVHVELNKIGKEGHRRFTGKDWEENVFLEEITDWYYSQIKDLKFGGRVDIEFDISLTAIDKERGWSWHVKAIVYSDNQRTVQVFSTENVRREDKPSGSNAVLA